MKVAVILGSTREGRQTDRMAKWIMSTLKDAEGVEAEFLDLKDYELPFFFEPISPKYNPNRKPEGVMKRWLDKIAQFEAYIIVTPEYNHSIQGVLKNALDFIDFQVMRKPFAFVSHGSAGGARDVEHLKQIISEIKGVAISSSVTFTHRVGENFDESGNIKEALKNAPYGPQAGLNAMVEELNWYSDALATARAK